MVQVESKASRYAKFVEVGAELFRVAKEALDRQLGGNGSAPAAKTPEPTPVPSIGNGSNGNGHSAATAGNGHGNGQGNGRKSYGRPLDPPTPKQRSLLRSVAKRRNLGPETIRDLCVRVVGKDPKDFTKVDMMKLLNHLLQKQEAA